MSVLFQVNKNVALTHISMNKLESRNIYKCPEMENKDLEQKYILFVVVIVVNVKQRNR